MARRGISRELPLRGKTSAIGTHQHSHHWFFAKPSAREAAKSIMVCLAVSHIQTSSFASDSTESRII